MDVVMLLKGALIAVVCGITEFLPISSNGHVIILNDVLHFKGPPGKLFEISLQLGAILAVCWLYRQKLLHTLCYITRDKADQGFALNIFLAFAPVAIVGFLFHHTITEHLFNVPVVASMLVIGGVAILAIEKWKPAAVITSVGSVTPRLALLIGLYQCLALIPGLSRSGATIMGAMLLGLERKAATEFSFLVAIPVIGMACFFDLFLHRHEITMDSLTLIALGFVIAFFCALLVVNWLLGFISRHGFVAFAWYRIIVGCAILAVLLAR